MRTIEEVVSELASELSRFLEEPKDQRERVKANLDHLKCGRCLNEIVEIHKAEKDDVLNKIRAEIVDLGQRTMNDNRASGIWACRDIIDKYKGGGLRNEQIKDFA